MANQPRLDSGIMSFEFKPSIGILARDIDRLGLDIRSFREPLKQAIQKVMIPSIRRNFDVGGRPAWEPLSVATLEIRAKAGFTGTQPLLRRGTLRRNMGFMTMWTITTESASIQDLPDRVWYGKVQQDGYGGMGRKVKAEIKAAGGRISAGEASRRATAKLDRKVLSGSAGNGGSVNIPARPFVMYQDEDLDAIDEVFDIWLATRAAKAGFIGGWLAGGG